jgi:hypothetical protein
MRTFNYIVPTASIRQHETDLGAYNSGHTYAA